MTTPEIPIEHGGESQPDVAQPRTVDVVLTNANGSKKKWRLKLFRGSPLAKLLSEQLAFQTEYEKEQRMEIRRLQYALYEATGKRTYL